MTYHDRAGGIYNISSSWRVGITAVDGSQDQLFLQVGAPLDVFFILSEIKWFLISVPHVFIESLLLLALIHRILTLWGDPVVIMALCTFWYKMMSTALRVHPWKTCYTQLTFTSTYIPLSLIKKTLKQTTTTTKNHHSYHSIVAVTSRTTTMITDTYSCSFSCFILAIVCSKYHVKAFMFQNIQQTHLGYLDSWVFGNDTCATAWSIQQNSVKAMHDLKHTHTHTAWLWLNDKFFSLSILLLFLNRVSKSNL